MFYDPRRGEESFDLVELARRLANVVRVATVAEVDLINARLRAKYDETVDGQDVITGWLPWLTARAGGDRSWWAPEVDEQVVLLSPSGELPQAVALPALYRDMFPAPSESAAVQVVEYSDGARVSYDRDAHALLAALPAGATARLEAPGGATVVGNLRVEGDVTSTGSVEDSTSTMQDMRDTYNGHSHPDQGASPPTQQMN